MKRKILSMLFLFSVLALSVATSQLFAQIVNPTQTNVLNFAARGDGQTDDSAALQSAIDATPENGTLFFPQPAQYYLLTQGLRLKSNIILKGDESTIFMPANDEENGKSIFYTDSRSNTANVEIAGLILKSSNQIPGSGYWTGSLISNNKGMYLQNTSNFNIHDLVISNMVDGIKIATINNSRISFKDVKILQTATDIYVSNASGIFMDGLTLDSTGFLETNHHLHNVYI